MSQFFPGGIVPTNLIERSRFLQKFDSSDEAGISRLAKEIDGLNPTDIMRFFDGVLGYTIDERIYSLIYQSPCVLGKMGLDCIEKHFEQIYRLSRNDLISREFFETCATSLVTGYNNRRHLNFLARLHAVVSDVEPDVNYVERFQSPSFDQAMAIHLSSILPHRTEHNQLLFSADSLRKIELPATFEVFLQDRVNAGDEKLAIEVVADLFIQDKLSDSYIDVCRKVLGDGLFLDTCQRSIQCENGLRSVVKLANIFGEGAFHTPEFFKSLDHGLAKGKSHVYLESLKQMEIDEIKLPLLANYIINNLKYFIKIDVYDKRTVAFVQNIVDLAHRMGKGASALRYAIDDIAREFPDFKGVNSSLMIHLIWREKNHMNGTLAAVKASSQILSIASIVGPHALKEVAPNAPSEFVIESMENNKLGIRMKEVMSIFPQTKGLHLDNELGL